MKFIFSILISVHFAQVCFSQPQINPNCPSENPSTGVVLLPHADCSKYYACNWGYAIESSCPDGLHFNAAASSCDYPYAAGCDPSRTTVGNGNPVQTTTAGSGGTNSPLPTISHEVTGEAPIHPNCPAEDIDAPVHFAHEYDCTRFYKCANGRAYLHVCPDNLHFNPREEVCDYPEDAGCDPNQTTVGGGITAPQTTAGGSQTTAGSGQTTTAGSGNTNSPLPTTSYEVTNDTPLHPRCPSEDGEFPYHFEHENDCTKFYKCSHGRAYVEVCDPPGLHFNRDLQVCDYPEDAGCDLSLTTSGGSGNTNSPLPTIDGTVTTTPGSGQTIATSTQEVEVENPLHPRCEGISFDQSYHFEHESDCSKFYMCSHGRAYLHNCPDYLHFNRQLQLCDWPASAGCA